MYALKVYRGRVSVTSAGVLVGGVQIAEAIAADQQELGPCSGIRFWKSVDPPEIELTYGGDLGFRPLVVEKSDVIQSFSAFVGQWLRVELRYGSEPSE